jgi:hypothetical protein
VLSQVAPKEWVPFELCAACDCRSPDPIAIVVRRMSRKWSMLDHISREAHRARRENRGLVVVWMTPYRGAKGDSSDEIELGRFLILPDPRTP